MKKTTKDILRNNKNILKIGGHVSVAGGLVKGVERAVAIGADTIQFFGSSPRGWAVQKHASKDIQEFQKAAKANNIYPLFIHANYLVNLASPDEALRKKSEISLQAQLRQANEIGAQGLIFHIGSGKEMPKEKALKIVINVIKRIMRNTAGDALLVIENSAGGGQKIGSSIKEIGQIIKAVNDSRVAVCFDTAHAFEAGIIENYTPKNIAKLLKDMENNIGLEKLVALHINDSKSAFNSHYDRHENIGEGYLGIAAFKNLLQEPDLKAPAWLLEVPGFDDNGPDKKNIDILKSLAAQN